jgi:hypothetical protein
VAPEHTSIMCFGLLKNRHGYVRVHDALVYGWLCQWAQAAAGTAILIHSDPNPGNS